MKVANESIRKRDRPARIQQCQVVYCSKNPMNNNTLLSQEDTRCPWSMYRSIPEPNKRREERGDFWVVLSSRLHRLCSERCHYCTCFQYEQIGLTLHARTKRPRILIPIIVSILMPSKLASTAKGRRDTPNALSHWQPQRPMCDLNATYQPRPL